MTTTAVALAQCERLVALYAAHRARKRHRRGWVRAVYDATHAALRVRA